MTARYLLALALVWTSPGFGEQAPYRPSDPDTVLTRLPVTDSAVSTRVAELRDALDAAPDNPRLAADLADAYIDIARQTADVRYYGYAQAALQPWWDMAQPPLDVLLPRAQLLQQRHVFDGARSDLEQLVARAPRNAQGWLTLANIERVTGRLDAADAACRSVLALAGAFIGGVCRADVAGLTGQGDAALDTLAQLLRTQSATPALQRWAQTVRAEIAWRMGRHDVASEALDAALASAEATDTQDIYLLALWADFHIAQGHADRVRQRLTDASDADADADVLLLMHAIAERQAGGSPQDMIAELRARIDAARRRGDSFHRREEARFALDLADRPGDALWLAQQNWADQREPADAHLLLRAALAAGQPAAAKPVVDFVRRWGLQDVRIEQLIGELAGTGDDTA